MHSLLDAVPLWANVVAWTSLSGVVVGTVQRSAVGAADVTFLGRFLRLALLDDLRRLRIGRDAMLQRLAQLDPGGGELQGVRINGHQPAVDQPLVDFRIARLQRQALVRSEEHTSELQSLMRISYAVFCLKKKTQNKR